MLYILCFCLAINQHIIEVNNAEDIEILIQSPINVELKESRDIHQIKE